MRYFAVGDIHGQRTMLRLLLERIVREYAPAPEDEFVFLGDYIDRGEDSKGVIDDLIAFDVRNRCIYLRGNHEQMMLEASETAVQGLHKGVAAIEGALAGWIQNGGIQTLASYGFAMQEITTRDWTTAIGGEHWQFLEATSLEMITAKYRFVHAGVVPDGIAWQPFVFGGSPPDPRLWIRNEFINHPGPFDAEGRVVVFGHTPQRGGPLVQRYKIGIDTGAVQDGGKLTCVILDAEGNAPPMFVQQNYIVAGKDRRVR